jgi:UDP-2,3-diacylglucosamine pyrophosphatase LpxH
MEHTTRAIDVCYETATMRTLVLGDLHLSTHTPRGVADDLVRLLAEHGGARVVFAGDFFDLSAERGGGAQTIDAAFRAHPRVSRALGEHVARGGEIVWLWGNHDPEMSNAHEVTRALALDANAASRVRVSPWFFRDGDLHVEHGHVFDPDNAPPHPLASARGTLGVHFVESFIAKTGAFHYLNANDKTPLELLTDAFRFYGLRGSHVVYTYFEAAFAALRKSGGSWDGERERARAERGIATFLEDAGVSEAHVRALMNEHATPTMSSLRDTFARLYLDRVAATVSVLAGLAAFAIGKRKLALALGAAGLSGLAWSWARGHDRYGGRVAARLDEGASRVARATGASLVVFGHVHEIADREGYSNTASFAFPRRAPGRPFLEIAHGRAERRFFTSA